MTEFYILIASCFAFFAFSPYYRYTALTMAFISICYAFIGGVDFSNTGLVYAFYVALDVAAALLILRWGDEGKLRMCLLFSGMITFIFCFSFES